MGIFKKTDEELRNEKIKNISKVKEITKEGEVRLYSIVDFIDSDKIEKVDKEKLAYFVNNMGGKSSDDIIIEQNMIMINELFKMNKVLESINKRLNNMK